MELILYTLIILLFFLGISLIFKSSKSNKKKDLVEKSVEIIKEKPEESYEVKQARYKEKKEREENYAEMIMSNIDQMEVEHDRELNKAMDWYESLSLVEQIQMNTKHQSSGGLHSIVRMYKIEKNK